MITSLKTCVSNISPVTLLFPVILVSRLLSSPYTPMPKTRRLLLQEITYSEAQDNQSNIFHKLTFPSQRGQFLDHVYRHRSWIQTVLSHHLNLRSGDACRVSQPDEWLHGSFNLCIPVQINTHNELGTNKILVRIPLPYRIGEAFRPGNADEKLRCEAGTYAWLQQTAPSIQVPRLYGFGLSTGQCVSVSRLVRA